MLKFTPGPWKVKDTSDYSSFSKGWREIRSEARDHVVTVCGYHSNANGDVSGVRISAGDAKLIAVSPEMYGILKAIHDLPILHDENGHAYKKVGCRSIFGTGATIGGLLKELDGE